MHMKAIRADVGKLTDVSANVLRKMGISEDDARIAASILVEADLRGVESPGVDHLGPFYVARIKRGEINACPHRTLASQSPSTAVMEADRGLGFVNGHLAAMDVSRAAMSSVAGITDRTQGLPACNAESSQTTGIDRYELSSMDTSSPTS
jgi:LDH2 family malate/lactate/ureidoglycolate dehydrogenase